MEATASEHISKKTNALMEALSFTLDDLQANRAGHLSERQRRYLSVDRQKNLLLGVGLLVGLIFVTTFMLFIGLRDSNLILQGSGMVLLVCTIGLSWFFGLMWVRATYDLRTNEPDVVEGKAQHLVRQFARAQAGSVRIGERVEVPTNAEAFKSFKPGATYRLYRTSHSHRLLSVELVD